MASVLHPPRLRRSKNRLRRGMIIFTGLGLLVPILFVGGLWIVGYVIDDLVFHQTGHYGAHL